MEDSEGPKRVMLDDFTITVGPTGTALSFIQAGDVKDVAEDLVEPYFETYDWGPATFYSYFGFLNVESVSFFQSQSVLRCRGGILAFTGASETIPSHVEVQEIIQELLDPSDGSRGLLEALQETQAFSFVEEATYEVMWEPTASPTQGPITPAPVPVVTTAPPTDAPTSAPTLRPTSGPTRSPTDSPTRVPTDGPTRVPTDGPTRVPTDGPTRGPTDGPTRGPTDGPTRGPTDGPTRGPTDGPTRSPTESPTDAPTGPPTSSPTESPTESPTTAPTDVPTVAPTGTPSETTETSPVPAEETTFVPTGSSTPLSTEMMTTTAPTSLNEETDPVVKYIDPSSDNGSSGASNIPIMAGVVASVLLLACAAAFLLYHRRRQNAAAAVWSKEAPRILPPEEDDDLEEGLATSKNKGLHVCDAAAMSDAGSSRLGRLLSATAAVAVNGGGTHDGTSSPQNTLQGTTDDDNSSDFDGVDAVEPCIVPVHEEYDVPESSDDVAEKSSNDDEVVEDSDVIRVMVPCSEVAREEEKESITPVNDDDLVEDSDVVRVIGPRSQVATEKETEPITPANDDEVVEDSDVIRVIGLCSEVATEEVKESIPPINDESPPTVPAAQAAGFDRRWSDVSSNHSSEAFSFDEPEFRPDPSWDFNDNDDDSDVAMEDPFQTPNDVPFNDDKPLLGQAVIEEEDDESCALPGCITPSIDEDDSDVILNDPFQTLSSMTSNDKKPLLRHLGTYKLEKVLTNDSSSSSSSEKRRRSKSAPPILKDRTVAL